MKLGKRKIGGKGKCPNMGTLRKNWSNTIFLHGRYSVWTFLTEDFVKSS